MSSPPDSTPARPRKRVQFEQWRKLMLLGAFLLLGNALADALMDGEPPRWMTLLLVFVGYGLLAVGFGVRMRLLKAQRAREAEAEKRGVADTGAE